jgi:hypothetical protein
VAFSSDNGTTATREVTVNASHLPASPGWVFFKFGITFAETNSSTYKVGIKSSSGSNATFYRNATAGNWARVLRRATTATIAGTDNVYISDELTGQGTKNDVEVTMDSTSSATTYGAIEIGGGGVLSYGTSASTNYHLKLAGNINVRGDGTFNIGTVATPIPRNSTAKLEFASASVAQYGLEVLAGGTFNAQGLSRTSDKDIYYCLLNTDEAVNSTSLGVDTDTGWLDNDQIAIAATGSVLAQYEVGALNGNATSDTLTVDGFAGSGGGLAFAHSGTAPTQAEVINLTRNVQIFGASSLNTTYLLFQTTAVVDMDWVEMYFLGSGTANKYGIDALTTTGSCSVQYCSIRATSTAANSAAFRVSGASANNITFSNNVLYQAGYHGIHVVNATSGELLTFEDNVLIRSVNDLVLTADAGLVFNRNRISGAGLTGVYLNDGGDIGEFASNVVHNCNTNGLLLRSSRSIENCTFYHNNIGNGTASGLMIETVSGVLNVTGCSFWGNRQSNVFVQYGGLTSFTNCSLAGTTTLASPTGLAFYSANSIDLRSCQFLGTSGVYAAHSNADIAPYYSTGVGQILLSNCLLGASSEVASPTSMRGKSYIGSAKHDQTAGSHRAWKQFGTITTDSTIFKTAAPSERLTPNNASGKLESGTKLVAIENATTKTVSVWVRESVTGDGTDYNGNRIRLRYRRSDAAGVTTDGTLATATASSEGAWQQLSGTTPAVTDDAVLEFYVDCDGTTGWISVDDWVVS